MCNIIESTNLDMRFQIIFVNELYEISTNVMGVIFINDIYYICRSESN
jgi:hypothetical protein